MAHKTGVKTHRFFAIKKIYKIKFRSGERFSGQICWVSYIRNIPAFQRNNYDFRSNQN
jgi:hypothetical protein